MRRAVLAGVLAVACGSPARETGGRPGDGCVAVEGDVLPVAVRETGGWTGAPLGLYNGLNTIYAIESSGPDDALAWVEAERVGVMRGLGMGTSRIHDADGYFSFAWPALVPARDGSPADYGATDLLVGRACTLGISLLPTASPATVETFGEGGAFLPDPDAWSTFVQDLVERYDGDGDFGTGPAPTPEVAAAIRDCPLHLWMVGNELDMIWAWRDPTWCPPETYAEALERARAAARAADPGARIVYGGLGPMTSMEDPQWQFFLEVLEASGGPPFDEMALHVYPADLSFLPELRSLLDALGEVLGAGVPIWVTEAGIPACYTEDNHLREEGATELTQARGLLALHGMLWARSPRPVLLIDVDWLGDLSPPMQCDELVERESGCPHLSWFSYRRMARLLAGADWTRTGILQESAGRYAWRIPRDGGGELLLVVPDPLDPDDAPGPWSLPVEGPVALVLDAVPRGGSGAEVWDEATAFGAERVAVLGGHLTLDPGDRPRWVLTGPDVP